MELKCALQTYEWGRRGTRSIVATLVRAADTDFVVEENNAYAELWMGTHPNGPSCLKIEGVSLKDYIDDNRQVLGNDGDGKILEELPFLFKILSVGKALSIQAHPDKKRAERLHLQQPQVYKDPNHKPELAIALGPFEAFCGFRPINEIRHYVEVLPELRAVIGLNESKNILSSTEDDEAFLKTCFEGILKRESKIVADQLATLIDRLSNLDEPDREFLHASLLERLHNDYPGDVGCFGIYLFNCVTLEAGEAIYIAPNEPHAYLSGDCVECMACSDNVVRAGLTPKPKDVTTLLEMLTYSCEPVSSKRFQPEREDEYTEIFRPPVRDFAVAKITITAERVSYDLIPRKTASILLIVKGEGEFASKNSCKTLVRGTVLFIPANEKLRITVSNDSVLMFQAFANVSN